MASSAASGNIITITVASMVLMLFGMAQCKFTITLYTLNQQCKVVFSSLEDKTPADLRSYLRDVLQDKKLADSTALCRPDSRAVGLAHGSSSELYPDIPLVDQGIKGSLLSPNSIILSQNVAVVVDGFANVKQLVTACTESTVQQVLARMDVSERYPEDKVVFTAPHSERRLHPKETRPIGGTAKGIKKIFVQPKWVSPGKWMVWVAAGWVKNWEHNSDGTLRLEVHTQPQHSVYALMDLTVKRIDPTVIEGIRAGQREDNRVIISNQLPIPGVIEQNAEKMARVDGVLYGLILYQEKLYEVTILPEEVDGIKKQIAAALGASDTSSLQYSAFGRGHFTATVTNQQPVITVAESVADSVQSTPTTITVSSPPPYAKLRDKWKTKRKQLKALPPASKMIILVTGAFVVLSAGMLSYVWWTADKDPVLENVERDLAETELIKTRMQLVH